MANEKTVVGHVITNPPRAVQVRVAGVTDGVNDTIPHDAIVANVTILTENRDETQKLLAAWPEVANALNLKIEEVVGRE